MPDAVEDPKIGLIAADIDIPDYRTTNVQVRTTTLEVQDFIAGGTHNSLRWHEKLLATGMNVLVLLKRHTPSYHRRPSPNECLRLCEELRRSDMEALANCHRARIVVNVETISEKDLGTPELLRRE